MQKLILFHDVLSNINYIFFKKICVKPDGMAALSQFRKSTKVQRANFCSPEFCLPLALNCTRCAFIHLRDLSLVPLQICQGLLGDPQVALNLPLGLFNVSAGLGKEDEQK